MNIAKKRKLLVAQLDEHLAILDKSVMALAYSEFFLNLTACSNMRLGLKTYG